MAMAEPESTDAAPTSGPLERTRWIPAEVGIEQLARARSPRLASAHDLGASVGLADTELDRLRQGGIRSIPVAEVPLDELLRECLDELSARGWEPDRCALALFTHSLPLTGDEMARLSGAVGDRCTRLVAGSLFLTGRPCSILHYGLQVARAALPDIGGGRTVLVLGGDVAPSAGERFFFGSAMGDAVVGAVLGHGTAAGTVLAVANAAHVIATEGTASPEADIQRFRSENPSAIRAVIELAMGRAGISWPDLDVVVPHTPYTHIWDAMSVLCGLPRDRFLDRYIHATGHLNSNDVLVHYLSACEDGTILPGQVAALVSPGFGGARGCTLVRR
jgi:3-oxoacyl-[acyl-carrier-protein] synthase III